MESGNRGVALLSSHDPVMRLATAAASNGLLTGQILFSLAFVGSCELPNWIRILW
jgi:hypothetical protein